MKPKIVVYHLKDNENCYNIYQSLEGVGKLLSDKSIWPIFIDLAFNPLIPDKVCSVLRQKPKVAYISESLIYALSQDDCTYTQEKYIDILSKKGHPILSFFGDGISTEEDLSGFDFLSLSIYENKPSINCIEELSSLPLTNFDFSVRTRNVLVHAKIKNIGELIKFSQRELMSLQNFGRKSFKELNKFLKEFGLSFNGDEYFDEVKLEEAYLKIFGKTEKEKYLSTTEDIKQSLILEEELEQYFVEKPKTHLSNYVSNDSKNYTNIFENFLESLDKLKERQCDILKKRIGFDDEPMTLEKLGELYNVTRERIRQIEASAIKKMNYAFSGWNPNNLWGDALENAFNKTISPLSAHHLSVLDGRFKYNDYNENVLLILLATTFGKSMKLGVVHFEEQNYLARARQQDIDTLVSAIPSLLPECEGKKIKEIEAYIRGIIPEELTEFTSLLLLDALKYSVIEEIDGEDYLQIYSVRKTTAVIAKQLFKDLDHPLSYQDIENIIQEEFPGTEVRNLKNYIGNMLDVFPFSHGTWGTIEMLNLTSMNNSQIITLVKDFLGTLSKDQFHTLEAFKFIEKHNRGLASLLDEYKLSGFIRYYNLAYSLGRNVFSQSSRENSRIYVKDLVIELFEDLKKPIKRNILVKMIQEIRPIKGELQINYPEISALGKGYYCLSHWKTNVVENGIYFQIDENCKQEFLDFSKDTSPNINRKVWTEKEIGTLLKLDKEGFSATSIATEMELSRYAVYNGIKRYRKSYSSPNQVLAETQQTYETKNNWTEDRVNTLKNMWADGYSASEIAKKIGATSRGAVLGKIHRLGISHRVPNHQQEENNLITNSVSEKNQSFDTNSIWTELDLKKLKKLNEFNYSYKNLAKILGKKEEDIINKLSDLK